MDGVPGLGEGATWAMHAALALPVPRYFGKKIRITSNVLSKLHLSVRYCTARHSRVLRMRGYRVENRIVDRLTVTNADGL